MIYLQQTIGKYDFEDGFVVSFVVDGYDEFGAHERFDVEKENLTIMQYTGLKDKNGKEIYEDDIARHPDHLRDHVITFNPLAGWLSNFIDGTSHEYIEVIGNIYENPELLK